MGIRIGVISYGEMTDLINRSKKIVPDDVELVIRDGFFEKALEQAKEIDGEDGVDVIISAGSNGLTIQRHIKAPYVDIAVTGFDFLSALKKAAAYSNNVGIITFQKTLPYLHSVSDVVKANICEKVYTNESDLETALADLRSMKFADVIGSSLVNERARERGMRGHFIYSEDGVQNALIQAINIAYAKKKEFERAKQFQTILEFTREGIVATDQLGVIKVFNRSAEKITGISSETALEQIITNVLPTCRLSHVIQFAEKELDQLQFMGGTKVLINRVPIVLKNITIGALATFQTIDNVQKAEQTIRKKLFDRGFVANNHFENIIGDSKVMEDAKRDAEAYAKSNSTILIKGETGTGKDIFAQSIHNASGRANEAFVAVNCAALSPSLLESELFGYEEGAFTGAKKGGKYGVFELAHKGTIFLDEVGEIPMDLQGRLLRVLEQREVFRVGGEKMIHIDIRVIAATNKNLWNKVKDGSFREDLYYRLNILELNIPPLRERCKDVPLLFEKFLRHFRPELSEEKFSAIANHPALSNYNWPGNIRELKNIVERFSTLFKGADRLDELFRQMGIIQSDDVALMDERNRILHILQECNGNKTRAAHKLGIGRTTMWRRLKE